MSAMKRYPLTDALVASLSARLCERGPLAGLARDVVAAVVRTSEIVELAAGELLIREGESATPEVFLLIDGTLVVQSNAGFIARLDELGAVVGEAAVVLGSKRSADVVAETEVNALVVSSQVLTRPEFADVAAGIRGAMLRDDWVQY
jgi:CRP-like cAMP-binding protein